MGSLVKSFNKKIELMYPRTKRTVGLFKLEDQRIWETPRQVIECIEKTMASGGIGTPGNFDLSWECLVIVLTIKALPKHDNEILGKF